MSKLIIKGGKPLSGTVKINGAKNSAVAIVAASLLFNGRTVLENIPKISDILILLGILEKMGAKVQWLQDDVVAIEVPDNLDYAARYEEVQSLRASNLLLGSLLGRIGKAEVSLPGGCDLGARPMDLHIKGFVKLGAEVETKSDHIVATSSGLKGAFIYLDFPSVGATENIMMAASVAEGQTVIENVAKEPEIVDLANFLNNGGAKIRGAGTDIIKIEGVPELTSPTYSIIPDRIEAGTFMAIAAMNKGNIKIENVISAHLNPVIAKMREAGVIVRPNGNDLYVKAPEVLKSVNIKTLAHPGFPTDMQPQMMSVLSIADGTSMVVENLFETRMKAAPELVKMGADIVVEGCEATIKGVEKLHGASVLAKDLRAGAALVAAALAAEGETEVNGLSYIDRGYWHMAEKLKGLGADVERVD
ncbi:MAG: UDP-N-acetylglucosamine 1-carboxyvinyltransferase [Clostridiales bacterium]